MKDEVRHLIPMDSKKGVKALQVQAQTGFIQSKKILTFIEDCLESIKLPLEDLLTLSSIPIGYSKELGFRSTINQDSWLCFNPDFTPCFYLISDEVALNKYIIKSRITNDSGVLNIPEKRINEFRKNKLIEFSQSLQLAKKGIELLVEKEGKVFMDTYFINQDRIIKPREYVNYRGLFVVWLRENTKIDYETIAAYLNRDHTTLIYSFKEYGNLKNIDSEVKRLWISYNTIMQSLLDK